MGRTGPTTQTDPCKDPLMHTPINSTPNRMWSRWLANGGSTMLELLRTSTTSLRRHLPLNLSFLTGKNLRIIKWYPHPTFAVGGIRVSIGRCWENPSPLSSIPPNMAWAKWKIKYQKKITLRNRSLNLFLNRTRIKWNFRCSKANQERNKPEEIVLPLLPTPRGEIGFTVLDKSSTVAPQSLLFSLSQPRWRPNHKNHPFFHPARPQLRPWALFRSQKAKKRE